MKVFLGIWLGTILTLGTCYMIVTNYNVYENSFIELKEQSLDINDKVYAICDEQTTIKYGTLKEIEYIEGEEIYTVSTEGLFNSNSSCSHVFSNIQDAQSALQTMTPQEGA